MPTAVHGDFEWDEDKATRNVGKHGVTFDEATLAMRDPFSLDFEDLVEAARLVTLGSLTDWAYPPRCLDPERRAHPHHQRP